MPQRWLVSQSPARSPPLGLDGPPGAPGEMNRLARRVGEDLAGVQGAAGVEDVFHAVHRVEVVVAVDPGHVCGLFEADAVLAGQGPAELDHGAENLLAGRLELKQIIAVSVVE